MDEEDIRNRYQSSCRVCLVHNTDGIQMAALFTTTYKYDVNVANMISCCASLEISPSDGLPSLICPNCLANLIAAYQFQIQCKKTDRELRIALGMSIAAMSNTHDSGETVADANVIPTILPISTDFAIKNEGSDCGMSTEMLDEELDTKKELNSQNFEAHIGMPIKNEELSNQSSATEDPAKSTTVPVPSIDFSSAGDDSEDDQPLQKLSQCKKVFDSNLICNAIKHSNNQIETKTPPLDKPRSYECSMCSRFFSKHESLSAHMKSHNKQMHGNEYNCEHCSKTFDKMKMLTRHIKSHDKFKHHKCGICDRIFAEAGQLSDHLNRHRGIKPFLCSECGKSFNNSSNLRQHMHKHTGVKPFVCNECTSRFSYKGALKSHMMTHSQVKPFVCDLCGSTFTKTSSLTKHKRIHTGERPYPCEMCDMRFNSSDHAKRHMRTHTGEKPYKCQYCERSYGQRNDLVKHTRSHVGENTYQCQDCPAAFRLQSELRQHSQTHSMGRKNAKKTGDDLGEKLKPENSKINSGNVQQNH